MNKKLRLLIVTVAVAVAVLVGAGVTLGIVLSDNASSGSLTTADLSLSAKAMNVKVFSAVPAEDGDTVVFEDENGQKYKYEQSVRQGDAEPIAFSGHAGSVSLGDTNITIDGIMPGDKVEFDIAVTSTSTVSFNYRAELYVDKSQGEELLNELEFSAGTLGLRRQSIDEESDADRLPAVLTDYTEWKTFSGNQAGIEQVHVTVSLPITATKGQGQTVKLYYVASGLQNTEEQPDVAQIQTADGTVAFKTLADAVAYAQTHVTSEIQIVDDTVLEEGAVTVARGVRFVGVNKDDNTRPLIKGVRLAVTENADVTFRNVAFGGVSYIDVSNASALTLADCDVNITGTKFFDAERRDYLSDAAFIVSGSSLTPVRLSITNSTFVSDAGAAVCMRSVLQNGSRFASNVFGTSECAYNGSAVLVLGGGTSGATVTVADNTLYGKMPLMLGGAATNAAFKVISSANKAYGADSVFVGGTAQAAFLDSGSTLNGNSLTLAQVAYSSLLFGGVDVALDADLRIVSGKIALSANLTVGPFHTSYVKTGALVQNAVELYQNGTLYAYLNCTGTGADYTVDPV